MDKEEFLKSMNVNLECADKIAIIAFNSDGTTTCGYHNMTLRDKALVKHELEIDIVDAIVSVNKDRYFDNTDDDTECIQRLPHCTKNSICWAKSEDDYCTTREKCIYKEMPHEK